MVMNAVAFAAIHSVGFSTMHSPQCWVRHAAIAGASERFIMNQTGHRSVQMVRRYIRDGNLFRENSAGKLGP